MENDTLQSFWRDCLVAFPEFKGKAMPEHDHFCDNQSDADQCAHLVALKIKQATSPSLWWFEKNQEALPKVGDLAIITDWSKRPFALIRNTAVEFCPFEDISEAYAEIEGEGDRSLKYWKSTHWAYYQREMAPFGEKPEPEMTIVCQYFETLYIAENLQLNDL